MTGPGEPLRDRWLLAEGILTRVMPAAVARMVLQEPRMLLCLARWLTGYRPAARSGCFGYSRDRTLLSVTFAVLVAVETAALHLVLVSTVGAHWWVWLITAVDAYTVVWILGFYASLAVLPHRLTPEVLHLRYGYLSDLAIPRDAITGVRLARTAGTRSGRLTRDGRGEHHYPCGETTVALDLHPNARVLLRGQPADCSVRTLHLTVDEPARLREALRAAQPLSPPGAPAGGPASGKAGAR